MELKKLTDNELVVLAKSNNDDAVTVLMERYKNQVSAICRPYFLIGGDNEDLLQECMIAFYKAIITYNGKASFSSYAYACMKNRIFSLIRKSNNTKNIPLNKYVSLSMLQDSASDKTDIVMSENVGPEESIINDESALELENKIFSSLSKYENEILKYYLKGLSYQTISEKMDKSIKSIDNALQRIRKKIAQLLD